VSTTTPTTSGGFGDPVPPEPDLAGTRPYGQRER